MNYFGKPYIFGEPLGLGRQATYISNYIRSEIKPTWWLENKETAGDIARNSVYVLPPGAELFTNPGVVDGVGSIYTFTGDDPDGYDIGGEVADDPEISEVAAGEDHTDSPTLGGGHVNIFTSADLVRYFQTILTIGDTYRSVVDTDTVTDGTIVRQTTAAGGIGSTITIAGIDSLDFITPGTEFGLKRGAVDGVDVTVAGHSVKKIGELDGLIVSATPAQAGLLGPNHAIALDGVDDLITVVDAPGVLSAMTTQKWAFLAKADDLGEASGGRFFNWGDTNARFQLLSSNRLFVAMLTDTTDAQSITDANEISDCLTEWAWYFMDYDDADVLGDGRVIRLWKGIDGVVTQLSLATETAATGTFTAPTDDLIIGNRVAADVTFDGLMDESFCKAASLWTLAEMQTIVNLTGV